MFLLSSKRTTAQLLHTARAVYSREQLIVLRPTDVPAEIWRRTHQGCRGGGQKRRRKETARQGMLEVRRRYKPCLPSIIMGNVQSLANKINELTMLAQSQREYRECSLMCFTESWIHQDIPDDNTSLEGFHIVRTDRVSAVSGKQKGGELALLVNNRWCKLAHISFKECCLDTELCTVGLRLYYLPREFTNVILVAV